jgi:hypothetical protein
VAEDGATSADVDPRTTPEADSSVNVTWTEYAQGLKTPAFERNPDERLPPLFPRPTNIALRCVSETLRAGIAVPNVGLGRLGVYVRVVTTRSSVELW